MVPFHGTSVHFPGKGTIIVLQKKHAALAQHQWKFGKVGHVVPTPTNIEHVIYKMLVSRRNFVFRVDLFIPILVFQGVIPRYAIDIQ